MGKSIILIFSLSMLLSNCTSSKTENNLDKSAPSDYNKSIQKTENNSEKSTPSDYYKSIQLKKIIPNQGIGKLKIEETRYKDIFDEKYSEDFYKKNGINLQFRKGDTLTGIELQNDGNYYINTNHKIGLTENEIIESLGKPENKNIRIKKGHINIGEMHSLNYEGFSIIFIDSKKSIISIFKNEP